MNRRAMTYEHSAQGDQMNAGELFITCTSVIFGFVAGTTIKTRPWLSIFVRGFAIAIAVFILTTVGGFVSDKSSGGLHMEYAICRVWPSGETLDVATPATAAADEAQYHYRCAGLTLDRNQCGSRLHLLSRQLFKPIRQVPDL